MELLTNIRTDPMVHIWPPYRDQKGLVEAHHHASLIACPSLIDCGPNVLVEAYQLGTPTLTSQMCGALGDLPPGTASQVQAPCWWQQDEPADAFTARLEEKLLHLFEYPDETPSSESEHVAEMLESIVAAWQTLLDVYN